MFNDIKEALDYIESKRVKRTFEQFQEIVTKYGFNVKQKNMIHIAGTNGKGSTVNFIKETGIDALAVAIGTNHGQYKSKTNLNFDRLKEIHNAVNIPLVIHGGTGVKEKDVKRVINLGIRKFNVGTELLVEWNRKSKECYEEHRENISNRENVVPCLDIITEIVEHKIHLFKNLDN